MMAMVKFVPLHSSKFTCCASSIQKWDGDGEDEVSCTDCINFPVFFSIFVLNFSNSCYYLSCLCSSDQPLLKTEAKYFFHLWSPIYLLPRLSSISLPFQLHSSDSPLLPFVYGDEESFLLFAFHIFFEVQLSLTFGSSHLVLPFLDLSDNISCA